MDDRLTLLKASGVTLEVPPGVTDGETSFRSYDADPDDETGLVSVHIERDLTFFRFEGELFVFDGVRWFPGIAGDDPMDAHVDLRRWDGGDHIDGLMHDRGHPGFTFRLKTLADWLHSGRLESADRPPNFEG